MTNDQFGALLSVLERIAVALEKNAASTGSVKCSAGAAHPAVGGDSPYFTKGLPKGYDTILGYLHETNPEAFALMEDPITSTMRDGYWLTHRAQKDGFKVLKVDAPTALLDAGILQVNAYPVELLTLRFA